MLAKLKSQAICEEQVDDTSSAHKSRHQWQVIRLSRSSLLRKAWASEPCCLASDISAWVDSDGVFRPDSVAQLPQLA